VDGNPLSRQFPLSLPPRTMRGKIEFNYGGAIPPIHTFASWQFLGARQHHQHTWLRVVRALILSDLEHS
jgi:hypothetical protein